MNNRTITVSSTDSFFAHCERACRIIETWPEWKKQATGVYRYSKKNRKVEE